MSAIGDALLGTNESSDALPEKNGSADKPAATLTAAERRERRRARILEDAESRMKRILSGPDGTEERKAPVLEGGEGFRAVQAVADSFPAAHSGPSPSLAELGIELPKHQFFDFLNTARAHIVLLVGVMFRLLLAFGVIHNVLVPWIVLFLSYELVLATKNKATFPEHGYLVNTLMWLNFSERFIVTTGFLFESLWNFLVDSATMMLAFLLTHSAFDGVSIIQQALSS